MLLKSAFLALLPTLAHLVQSSPVPCETTTTTPIPSTTTTSTIPTGTGSSGTADLAKLKTWTYPLNSIFNDPIAVNPDDKVRSSHLYKVKVALASAPNTWYDSFTHLSIPRSGRAKWGYGSLDGAEYSSKVKLSMAWNTFLYAEDVWVEVELLGGGDTIGDVNSVTIRPTNLSLEKVKVDGKRLRVKVPYRASGYRFSIEFPTQLYTTHNSQTGGVTMPGEGEPNDQGNGRAIHTEPRNALLIFAEPQLVGGDIDKYIPNPSILGSNSIHYPSPGEVNDLNNLPSEKSVIYFKPGIYYMPWNYHAYVPTTVKWVYIAPGAHVKGAFQFRGNSPWFKFTGYGVLSGEKYVYEPDTANGYKKKVAAECHATCVKMIRYESVSGVQQHLDLQGVTVSDPPYHSYVVYGAEDEFDMDVRNYHMVGAWYWQTDGLELYKGSKLRDTFFHANDDVLKIYHSNVQATDVVIWKNENGPIIQWGWTPRTISNVLVDKIDIIHNRIWWKDVKVNTCIINSSPHWENTADRKRGDPNQLITGITMSNIRSEGMNPCSIRIHALSSTENIKIKNLWIEKWNDMDVESQIGIFTAYTNGNGQKVNIGNQSSQGKGLSIENYVVGNTKITKALDNWRDSALGRLGFDGELWDNWNAF